MAPRTSLPDAPPRTAVTGPQSRPDGAETPWLTCGTMVATPEGDVPAGWLRPGDLVLTRDGGPRPLLWICRAARDLDAPVACIPSDRFGPGLPAEPLVLSRAHGVLVSGPQLELHFGDAEMLAPASAFCADAPAPGADGPGWPAYDLPACHLFLDRHDMVLAEGIWVETVLRSAENDAALSVLADAWSPLPPSTGPGSHPRSCRARLMDWECRVLPDRFAGVAATALAA